MQFFWGIGCKSARSAGVNLNAGSQNTAVSKWSRGGGRGNHLPLPLEATRSYFGPSPAKLLTLEVSSCQVEGDGGSGSSSALER